MTTALEQVMADLATLYEGEAYRLLALAERITCDRETALRAAERAFVALAAGPADDEEIVAVAAACAMAEAPQTPSESAWPPLAALAPPLRAALAVRHFCDVEDPALAHALSLPPEPAAAVLARAERELAAAAATSLEQALARYAELPWPDPPRELWERVHAAAYTNAHARLEQPAAAPPAPRRLRRVHLAVAGAAAVALVIGGVSIATGGPAKRTRPVAAPAHPADAAPVVRPSDETAADLDAVEPGTLTPERLDRLRIAELRDVSNHAREELTERSRRDDAAEERAALIQRRLAAEKRRARRLRERLEQERLRDAVDEPAAEAPARPRKRPRPAKPEPTATPAPVEEEATECVYEEQSGSYICPEDTP